MRATVFFITLSEAQSADVNAKGWDGTPQGRAYMEATCKANPVSALAWGLYEAAASGEFISADDAFAALQKPRNKLAMEMGRLDLLSHDSPAIDDDWRFRPLGRWQD